MASLAWGGHNNGRIPAEAMSVVRGELFRKDAAYQMLLFEKAFEQEFGYQFVIAEGYRSLERQQKLRAEYLAWVNRTGPWAPIANYVGHSVHGWGLAADLWTGIDKFGTKQHNWAVKNGPRFGWRWGSTPSEPWHFEFANPIGAFADTGIEILDNTEATLTEAPTPVKEIKMHMIQVDQPGSEFNGQIVLLNDAGFFGAISQAEHDIFKFSLGPAVKVPEAGYLQWRNIQRVIRESTNLSPTQTNALLDAVTAIVKTYSAKPNEKLTDEVLRDIARAVRGAIVKD